MCNQCPPGRPGIPSKQRRKLWELDTRCHCPVVGTCLTLAELEKIARQAGFDMNPRPSDFQLHVALVHECDQKYRPAKLLQKFLDKQFARHIKQLPSSACRNDLADRWNQAAGSGELPGVFWAVISHPSLDKDLADRIYGEIHMLSHISGSSHRTALARLPVLKQQTSEAKAELKAERLSHQAQLKDKDARIRQLESELAGLRGELAQAQDSTKASPELDTLQANLDKQLAQNDGLTQRLVDNRLRLDAQSTELEALRELLEETRDELTRTEQSLRVFLGRHNNSTAAANKNLPDLSGRNIVYVGGRPSALPHLRSLVESYAGEFSHHDGGQEDSRNSLEPMLVNADLVFCPIDCISHDACLRVKRVCKQNAATFVPLRTASLASFVKGLHQATGPMN